MRGRKRRSRRSRRSRRGGRGGYSFRIKEGVVLEMKVFKVLKVL